MLDDYQYVSVFGNSMLPVVTIIANGTTLTVSSRQALLIAEQLKEAAEKCQLIEAAVEPRS